MRIQALKGSWEVPEEEWRNRPRSVSPTTRAAPAAADVARNARREMAPLLLTGAGVGLVLMSAFPPRRDGWHCEYENRWHSGRDYRPWPRRYRSRWDEASPRAMQLPT